MKATEVIRSVLDLIDQIDCAAGEELPVIAVDTDDPVQTGVDSNRFKHILDMLAAERGSPRIYDNSPVEVVADIQSVTTDAGGGWMGPKNPSDLRGNSFSLFPSFQAESKE